MVYEIKCHQCGSIIDFGGSGPAEIPEDAIEWDENVYCQKCVEEFVRLGVGDVRSRVTTLEDTMDKVADALGIEFELNPENRD